MGTEGSAETGLLPDVRRGIELSSVQGMAIHSINCRLNYQQSIRMLTGLWENCGDFWRVRFARDLCVLRFLALRRGESLE